MGKIFSRLAGYFEKDIRDFIGREEQTLGNGPDNGFSGDYAGFILRTTRNFGSASIKGWELNYHQRLSQLQGIWKGLSVFANYTDLKTAGQYDGSGQDELVGFVPKMLNAGVFFDVGRFNLSAKYNYQGGSLLTFNADPTQRTRTTNVGTWDFNVRYRIAPQISVFVDIANAFNKWPSWYTGNDSRRVTMSEVYGTRVGIGLTGAF